MCGIRRMKETLEYFEKVSLLYEDLSATITVAYITLNPRDICKHMPNPLLVRLP